MRVHVRKARPTGKLLLDFLVFVECLMKKYVSRKFNLSLNGVSKV